jgi:quercetin dioxygenase-like cupin family protein
MPFLDTQQLALKEPIPGWQGRFFNSENMTFGYYDFVAGASIHEHHHPNEETWHVLEGQLEISIAGNTQVAGPGFAATVPANTAHQVRALTNGRAIVVDFPRRESLGGIKL